MQIQGTVHNQVNVQHSEKGNAWIELVLFTSEFFRGTEFKDYYPVRFFGEKAESVAKEIRQGDLALIDFDVRGQENVFEDRMTGESKVRYQVNLMGKTIEIYNRSDSKYSRVKNLQPSSTSQAASSEEDNPDKLPF